FRLYYFTALRALHSFPTRRSSDLGWFLDRLRLSEEMFWGSVLIFAGAAAAGAITLSEHLRWRLRRFIGMHFYGSKYDYRAQWMRSEEHTSELQSRGHLVCRLLLEK